MADCVQTQKELTEAIEHLGGIHADAFYIDAHLADDLLKEIEHFKALLDKYGGHTIGCAAHRWSGHATNAAGKCDCGYDEAMKGVKNG